MKWLPWKKLTWIWCQYQFKRSITPQQRFYNFISINVFLVGYLCLLSFVTRSECSSFLSSITAKFSVLLVLHRAMITYSFFPTAFRYSLVTFAYIGVPCMKSSYVFKDSCFLPWVSSARQNSTENSPHEKIRQRHAFQKIGPNFVSLNENFLSLPLSELFPTPAKTMAYFPIDNSSCLLLLSLSLFSIPFSPSFSVHTKSICAKKGSY